MNLFYRVLKLRPTVKPSDFDLQDNSDGNGPYIAAWRSEETQPTLGELASVDDSPPAYIIAQAEINRLEALETPRRMAEAALGREDPEGWLAANRALIDVERAKLVD